VGLKEGGFLHAALTRGLFRRKKPVGFGKRETRSRRTGVHSFKGINRKGNFPKGEKKEKQVKNPPEGLAKNGTYALACGTRGGIGCGFMGEC